MAKCVIGIIGATIVGLFAAISAIGGVQLHFPGITENLVVAMGGFGGICGGYATFCC